MNIALKTVLKTQDNPTNYLYVFDAVTGNVLKRVSLEEDSSSADFEISVRPKIQLTPSLNSRASERDLATVSVISVEGALSF